MFLARKHVCEKPRFEKDSIGIPSQGINPEFLKIPSQSNSRFLSERHREKTCQESAIHRTFPQCSFLNTDVRRRTDASSC